MRTRNDDIRTYFDRAASTDLDSYFDQFAPTALLDDEGHEYRGIAEIRGWRTTVAPVSYEVLEVTADDGTSDGSGITTARTRISGDFPGSPVTLAFRFGFDDEGRISLLTIRT